MESPLIGDMEAPEKLEITPEEVEKHNTRKDGWIILNGEALDVTRWISLHPGGEQTISSYLGKDASTEWNMIHQPGTVERHSRFVKKLGRVSDASNAEIRSLHEGGGSGAGLPWFLGCCRRRKEARS
mmetsp:Transcript_21555/g.50162  ORF Transcript_21555/g.50162 Transcript_21555/m.50162 type:complete len:127 (+) Transcript_21555:30-410(+)